MFLQLDIADIEFQVELDIVHILSFFFFESLTELFY